MTTTEALNLCIEALMEALIAIDEAYIVTGYVRVATSTQRQRIEGAIAQAKAALSAAPPALSDFAALTRVRAAVNGPGVKPEAGVRLHATLDELQREINAVVCGYGAPSAPYPDVGAETGEQPLTTEEVAELEALRREFHLASLGDRLSSLAAGKIRRMLELETRTR